MFIHEFIILLPGTIMVAMRLTLYHGVHTAWIALWIKKSGSQMRLLSLIWTYIYNMGFVVALQKKKFTIET
jgi:hypothetical protein